MRWGSPLASPAEYDVLCDSGYADCPYCYCSNLLFYHLFVWFFSTVLCHVVFTMPRYAGLVYAVIMYPSVHTSVGLVSMKL